MNEKSKQRKKKKRITAGELYPLTRAVTHIRLVEVNPGKLAALDALAPVYFALCQQYVTLFCTTEPPNKLRDPLYRTPLSERWHRVAIMQAAGIARSWRSNRTTAYQQYQDDLEQYKKQQADGQLSVQAKEPQWREWNVPTLRQPCIQANVNVVKLEESHDSTYDYWLIISTLEKGQPIQVPVKLAAYHKRALTDSKTHKVKKLNSSVQLNQRFTDPEHEGVQFAYEQLSVASMRFKARAQNAYLRASYLGHIPQQILWNSQKRGVKATPVISAYSSQECSVCHYADRKNRPDQRTFRCQVCGFEAHADYNASVNLSRRIGDRTLCACKDRKVIKAVLMKRHEAWKQQQGMRNIRPAKRRERGKSSA